MARKEGIIAAAFLLYSLLYFFSSLRMDLGTLDSPGCGVMPQVVGLFLVIFTGVNAYRTFVRKKDRGREGDARAGGESYLRPLGMMLCVIAYPFLLGGVRFLTATFLILFAMLRVLRFRKTVGSALIAAVVSLGTFLVFTKVLGVVFPSGALEHYVYALF